MPHVEQIGRLSDEELANLKSLGDRRQNEGVMGGVRSTLDGDSKRIKELIDRNAFDRAAADELAGEIERRKQALNQLRPLAGDPVDRRVETLNQQLGIVSELRQQLGG